MAMNINRVTVNVESVHATGVQNNFQPADMPFAQQTQETLENNEAPATFSGEERMSNETVPDQPEIRSQLISDVSEITEDFCEKVVIVQPADVQLCEQIQRENGYYPIKDFKRKGCALILSNDFEGHEGALPGYNIDKENMRKLWEDLGCNLLDVESNKNAEEIKEIIRGFADKIKDSNPSFIVVVIMSHGSKQKDKQVFYGNDWKPVEVNFVLKLFNNENAHHLQNIPKLFVFQFCRGDNTDLGIRPASHNPGTSVASDIDQPTDILPVYSDQFVAYPAHDDYTALVGENGSWFINAITNIFMRYAKDEHVADLFTMVNKELKYKTWEATQTWKQMSVNVSSLTEKLYLYPGYRPESSN